MQLTSVLGQAPMGEDGRSQTVHPSTDLCGRKFVQVMKNIKRRTDMNGRTDGRSPFMEACPGVEHRAD